MSVAYARIAIGILIAVAVLKPVFLGVAFSQGGLAPADVHRFQNLAELCVPAGLLAGWWMARPLATHWTLKAGVWAFFAAWMLSFAIRNYPMQANLHVPAAVRYLANAQILYGIAFALILYGLARILLSPTLRES